MQLLNLAFVLTLGALILGASSEENTHTPEVTTLDTGDHGLLAPENMASSHATAPPPKAHAPDQKATLESMAAMMHTMQQSQAEMSKKYSQLQSELTAQQARHEAEKVAWAAGSTQTAQSTEEAASMSPDAALPPATTNKAVQEAVIVAHHDQKEGDADEGGHKWDPVNRAWTCSPKRKESCSGLNLRSSAATKTAPPLTPAGRLAIISGAYKTSRVDPKDGTTVKAMYGTNCEKYYVKTHLRQGTKESLTLCAANKHCAPCMLDQEVNNMLRKQGHVIAKKAARAAALTKKILDKYQACPAADYAKANNSLKKSSAAYASSGDANKCYTKQLGPQICNDPSHSDYAWVRANCKIMCYPHCTAAASSNCPYQLKQISDDVKCEPRFCDVKSGLADFLWAKSNCIKMCHPGCDVRVKHFVFSQTTYVPLATLAPGHKYCRSKVTIQTMSGDVKNGATGLVQSVGVCEQCRGKRHSLHPAYASGGRILGVCKPLADHELWVEQKSRAKATKTKITHCTNGFSPNATNTKNRECLQPLKWKPPPKKPTMTWAQCRAQKTSDVKRDGCKGTMFTYFTIPTRPDPILTCQVFTGGFGLYGQPGAFLHSHNNGLVPSQNGEPHTKEASGASAPLGFTCARTWGRLTPDGDYKRYNTTSNMTRSATYIIQSAISECHSTDDDLRTTPTLACVNKKKLQSCVSSTIVIPSEVDIQKAAEATFLTDGTMRVAGQVMKCGKDMKSSAMRSAIIALYKAMGSSKSTANAFKRKIKKIESAYYFSSHVRKNGGKVPNVNYVPEQIPIPGTTKMMKNPKSSGPPLFRKMRESWFQPPYCRTCGTIGLDKDPITGVNVIFALMQDAMFAGQLQVRQRILFLPQYSTAVKPVNAGKGKAWFTWAKQTWKQCSTRQRNIMSSL